jgi:hypothetical protein
MRYVALAAFGISALLSADPAFAQPEPGQVTVEAVAAVTTSSAHADDPSVFLDGAATVRMGSGFDAVVRPYARRLPGGDWDALMYQLQVRYQSTTAIPVRIDAGIITSPLGLGTLELRADVNPTVGAPSYYFSSLPRFDSGSDRVQLMSGGYPLGAVASVSGEWWDARGGVTDGTPARSRKVPDAEGPARMAQFIAGAGVTPMPGLRFGTGFAKGAYRRAAGLADAVDAVDLPAEDRQATVLNVEGEYAFGFTRVSGEWVRDRFETDRGAAVARGFYVQAVQTLTPRIFAAGRIVRVSSPSVSGARERMGTVELTSGYRLTREWIVKGGYQATRKFGQDSFRHAAVGSLVWSQRWFR